jgi:5-formyltetrahydrofolate cyclo-ligase
MVTTTKNELRRKLAKSRQEYFERGFQDKDVTHVRDFVLDLLHQLSLDPPLMMGGYWSLKDEFPLQSLLLELYKKGYTCALPCIEENSYILTFRPWTPEVSLVKGNLGVFEPPSSLPFVQPDILFVPLVAFDSQGNRLGRGGSYYDSTITSLRTLKKIITIGIAFDFQKVSQIPVQLHDQSLDYVITPSGILGPFNK